MKRRRLHRACPVSGAESRTVQAHSSTVSGEAPSGGFSKAIANAKAHGGVLSPSQAQIFEVIEGLDRAAVGEAGDMLTAIGLLRGESNRCKDGALLSVICKILGQQSSGGVNPVALADSVAAARWHSRLETPSSSGL